MADVIIVGAGLAGLVCAQDLSANGIECLILEASDGVGGRVRTDAMDGFLLDRGFQILLTAYPQVQKRLDLDVLELGLFEPGARVRTNGRFHHLSDPLRRPFGLPRTVAAPVGSIADKAKLVRLIVDVRTHPVRALLRRPDETTAARLERAGFSSNMIEAFWRPLFAGIQLDPELEVSSRRFETILRMLAVGSSGLPRQVMGSIATQLASKLPPSTVRFGARAVHVGGSGVTLANGESVAAKAVVVATEGPEAHRLIGDRVADPGSRAAACCWFSAHTAPLPGPVLVLDGDQSGPMRNLVVISEVCPSYAPAGRALVAAAVPGPDALDPELTIRVRSQLARWFDTNEKEWEHLRTDVIAHGQPAQRPPLRPKQRIALGHGLFVCGDHRDTASIQGAMFSGERTAAAVGQALRG
jgi:phytoene dehydrogenase-like protein